MIKLLIVLLFLCSSSAALGDPNVPMLAPPGVELLELPKGTHLVVDGMGYRAYTFQDLKLIAHIYADYRSWGQQIPDLNRQIELYTELSINQYRQISSLSADQEVMRKENKRLLDKWETENKLRHEAENRPWWGNWAAWGVAAVATATVAVLTGVLIAK